MQATKHCLATVKQEPKSEILKLLVRLLDLLKAQRFSDSHQNPVSNKPQSFRSECRFTRNVFSELQRIVSRQNLDVSLINLLGCQEIFQCVTALRQMFLVQ